VTAARRPESESIFHNTRCDWDLIAMIQDLIVRWCKGIALSFHWVKGHPDLIDRPLTRYEILNIEADIQAHVIRVKLLPLPQPPVRARTDARTNPSAQRATQLRSVLTRVYAVSIQNQITTTVP
jgi:hypothetical protein